jgi:hypothetical protein
VRGLPIECGWRSAGLVILERNYLDVYIYDKWTAKFLPNFEEGQHFMPTVCELRDGTTTAPSYLTEADLVTMMDQGGIGRKFIFVCDSVGLSRTQERMPRLLNTFKPSSTANMSWNAWKAGLNI